MKGKFFIVIVSNIDVIGRLIGYRIDKSWIENCDGEKWKWSLC